MQAGLPLLISGRFTAFGMGVPTFIRVFLEGPSYDPQLRSFDTFASPFSGDYSTNVIAEKDGQYNVYAQAFPPPLIPTGPPFPEAMMLLPPIAESTRPPLVVGYPFDGGVDALLPDGTRQRLTAPPMMPIEFRPIITVAPGITVAAPGVPAYPAIPYYPPAPPPTPPGPPTPPEAIRAAVDDILFVPPLINPGMEATGTMVWRNTGAATMPFDTVFYLIGPVGTRYGPLQVNQNIRVVPQIPNTTTLRLNTSGLPSGIYSVDAEIYDSETGMLAGSRTVSNRLQIREIAPPVPPPPPTPVPTIDILGTPSLNLPRQLNVGDVWSGSVSLPTFGTIPYFVEAHLVMIDPSGYEYTVGQGGRTLSLGETLQIPVSYDTSGFTAGNYTILLRIFDQLGNQIAEFPMGFLSMIEAIAPPLPPVPPVPEIPTTPTADMFDTPSVNLPTELEIGQMWQGSITIPTIVPPALLQLPSLPALPVNIGLQLQDPAGQLFDVATFQRTFTPGQPISLPVNFGTSVLTREGMHDLIMNISDIQGNPLLSRVIGLLRALMPAIPPPPPVPELSQFTNIQINLGPSQVEVGQSIDIPVTYTHVGASEVALLYASIGQFVAGVYDEIWHNEKRVTVDAHPVPTPIPDSITITITPKLITAGIYTVEAKINTFVPKVSTRLLNIIEVFEVPVAPPTPPVPALPRADIADIDFRLLTTGLLDPGDTVSWIMTGVYKGRAQGGSLAISLGTGPGRTFFTQFTLPPTPVNFDESYDWQDFSFRGSFTIPRNVELGQTYSIRARLEALLEPTQETDTDWGVITITTPPAPPAPPPIPPSEFTAIRCTPMIPAVRRGDPFTIFVYHTHVGASQGVRVYTAIGKVGVFGFDEQAAGWKTITVPDDTQPIERVEAIDVPTAGLSPGTYSIYAKLEHPWWGEVHSPVVEDVVTILMRTL